ncbi:hypothetical protein HSX11_05670 [Oxalobacteraceae bacterium]|nr:hypothetical protein [Oxalobacteraceae bacterium]
MTMLSESDWLQAWERSCGQPAALRPCAVLAPLFEQGQAAAERLSVGQRDACLIDLCQALFGPGAHAVAHCPRCAELLEMELSLPQLRLPAPPEPEVGLAHGLELALDADGARYRLSFRLPDSADLAAIAAWGGMDAAKQALLGRCVIQASRNDLPVAVAALPPTVVAALAQAMAEADPQAASELALECPACGHRWNEVFDISHFLLHALDDWAQRLLDQVHMLAKAYGWTEATVLALTPMRRARYLERVLA